MKKIIFMFILCATLFADIKVGSFAARQWDTDDSLCDVTLHLSSTDDGSFIVLELDRSGYNRRVELTSNLIDTFLFAIKKFKEWDAKASALKVDLAKNITTTTTPLLFDSDYEKGVCYDSYVTLTLRYVGTYAEKSTKKDGYFFIAIAAVKDDDNSYASADALSVILDPDSLSTLITTNVATLQDQIKKKAEISSQFQ